MKEIYCKVCKDAKLHTEIKPFLNGMISVLNPKGSEFERGMYESLKSILKYFDLEYEHVISLKFLEILSDVKCEICNSYIPNKEIKDFLNWCEKEGLPMSKDYYFFCDFCLDKTFKDDIIVRKMIKIQDIVSKMKEVDNNEHNITN